jgi:capsular exopolysaccharide synthesis family protein
MSMNQLQKYIRPFKGWWWLIITAAVVAGITCFVYLRLQPEIYQSHATLMVGSEIQDPNPDSASLQLGQYLARSYANIAQRSTLQEATKAALGMDWLPEYSARAVPETQMIDITVTDSDPQRAQRVAQELVNQLILLSPGGKAAESRGQFVQEQLAGLETDITATEENIEDRQAELAKATSARQIVSLEAEITALSTKLGSLRNTYSTLFSSTQTGAVNAINILEAASLPLVPVDSGGMKLVLLASILGAMLAVAGIYLLDFMDDTLTSVDQVSEDLALPTLGSIPHLAPEVIESEALVTVGQPHSPAAESYRVLRSNLQFVSFDSPFHTLQITSPSPGDGKTQVAANLAIAIAQAGKRVILVDCDLRRPAQHRLLGLRNNVGVTTALLGDEHALAAAMQTGPVPGLNVLTTGPLPPNPSEMLGSHRMAGMLETLRGLCDVVILDSPPVTAVSDSAVLAAQSDGVLLVLRSGQTSRDQAKRALAALNMAHAPILGVALNSASEAQNGFNYRVGTEYSQYYGTYAAHRQKQSSVPASGVQPPPSVTAPTVARSAPSTLPFMRRSQVGDSYDGGKEQSQGISQTGADS